MNQGDPTDHALATIASILDNPESPPMPEKTEVEVKPKFSAPPEADGYSKIGPGPMEAIRFKWTVRREDDDNYYVDETIGEKSQPIVSGPMPADAAIRLVDDREYEARRRYEAIKSEIAGRSSVPGNLPWKNSGEI